MYRVQVSAKVYVTQISGTYDRYVFRPGLYLEVSVRWRNLWTLALNCLLVTLLILGLELACGLQEAALAVRGCVKQRIEVTY